MSQFANLDPFAARQAKLGAWKEAGVNPYPARLPESPVLWDIAEARVLGEELYPDGAQESSHPELGKSVAVCGRIMALRTQGALAFLDLRDRTGKLQLLIKQDAVAAELFERLDWLDLGDFLWASGKLLMSRRGELTLAVEDWKLAAKTLRPMPDLWKGLTDLEQRQRQRYAELLVNPEVKDRFVKRSKLVAAIRSYMNSHDFLEVETPVLESVPGGADAEPFTTHHNALDQDFYLRISLELYLKRMVVGGFERVYEIDKVFRNEGISPQHLQEFTMFELYWAYADYNQLMDFVEEMYRNLVVEVFGGLQVTRGEQVLDFAPAFPRRTYQDLLKEYAGIDVLAASDQEIIDCIVTHGLKSGGGADQAVSAEGLADLGRGRLLDLLYKKTVRPNLVQPCFVIDHPLEFSPLAKKKEGEPRLTERFVVVVDGSEVGNAFSELNDPLDQRARFEEQEKLRAAGDMEAQRLDEDFLRALEYGMPPTAGFGVGIDRLMAVLAGLESVRETVLFPLLRKE